MFAAGLWQLYQWHYEVVVPEGHPPLALERLTLAQLAEYPIITYDLGFTGRSHIDDAFRGAGIATDIVLTAMDSDVMPQYGALRMGVGIVASLAIEQGRHAG